MEAMARRISLQLTKMGRLSPSSLFVVLILGIAAFFRLYHINDYLTFLGDEGRDALVVYNILHGDFTLLGPTASVGGFFMGPIYYYFMAPFLWLFNYDPVGPAVMVALLGVVTVWFIYKVGSEFFGKKAGLIASSLYAISPLVVTYSRSSWNPNIMPFFTLMTLYVLYKGLRKNSWRLLVIGGVLYGICIQLHYIETFLGVIIAIFLWFGLFITDRVKPIGMFIKKLIRNYLLFFVGFLIGWSPFLAFEVRHGFPNLMSIVKFVFHTGETGRHTAFFDIIFQVYLRLFGRLLANFPPPEKLDQFSRMQLTLWQSGTFLLALACTGLLIFLFVRSIRAVATHKEEMTDQVLHYSMLLFWLGIGILLFGFYKNNIYDYYFQFLFPLPFLLVGLLIATLFHLGSMVKKREVGVIGKIGGIVIFAGLLWINLQTLPFKEPANKQKDQVRMISEFVLSKTEGKPFNFALITQGNSDHAYRYFFKLAGRDAVVVDNPQKDPYRKTVTDQLLIVCEDPGCEPLGNSLWEVAGFGRAEIVDMWDVSVVTVYKLVPYSG